jgi:hypothetical protein
MIDGADCTDSKHLTKGNTHEGTQSEIRYVQFTDIIKMQETQTAVV